MTQSQPQPQTQAAARVPVQAQVQAPVQAPPHAPELGPMRKLLGSFHVTGIFWYRIHRWGVTILPKWAVGAVIFLFTSFFFVVLRRIRAAIAANLAVAIGPTGFWGRQVRIYRTFWQFAWCLSERYEMLSTDRHTQAEASGSGFWEEQTGGVVLTTAHIGPWEVGAMMTPNRDDRTVNVVREEEMDSAAQDFLVGMFDELEGAKVIFHFAHDDPSLGLRMLGALRRGEIVAVQSDRPRTGGRTVRAELFGRPFEIPAGPIAMARAAGVPMLPIFVFRRGRLRSEVVMRPPIDVPRTGPTDEVFEGAAQRLADEIEWAIRQAPHQWFCFRSLWPGPQTESAMEAQSV